MHYLFMRKICAENFGNIQPYESKILLSMSLIFVFTGLALMFTYQYEDIRHAILVLILIMAFLKRKDLMSMFKKVLFFKNEE